MNAVEKYYENNTRWFLKLGAHHKTQCIHRSVWGEGVTTKEEAVNYVNRLVLSELQKLNNGLNNTPPNVVDLGCGVGGSVFYLARHEPTANYYGITISAKQASIAQNIAQTLNMEGNCQFIPGDYHQLPDSLPDANLAYAIEAFSHSTDPETFFEQIGKKLHKGDKLIICDDICSEKPLGKDGEKYINRFKDGWIIGTLTTVSSLERMAALYNFKLVDNRKLSNQLELGRPRDKFIKLVVSLLHRFSKHSSYLKSLVGGDALQTNLMKGWIEYRFLIFEKQG